MTFPNPNVTTEYESPEGIKYVWNGFAWEIKCGGGVVVVTPPYTIDAEDDTHWGDHRLEEVGYPVAANDAATKGYVDAAVSPGVTLFGDGGKWRTLNEGSTIERYIYFQIAKKGSDSPYIPYGNVLYLDKLIAADGTLQSLKDYTPTDVSMLEVYVSNELYFKGLLNPTTYKVAQRNNNEIVCDFASEFALVAKGGTDWSISTTYRLILTGMQKKNG